MAKRRGHREGSIAQRADGRWQVMVDLGRGLDGRRQRKIAYAHTQDQAITVLGQLRARAQRHALLSTSTPTVAQYLAEWYALGEDDWRPSTRRCYRNAIDTFLVPAFGPLRLSQLTPVVIQRWLTAHKAKHGARRRIELAHSVLRSALSAARGLQLVDTNAAEPVRVPRRTQKRTITPLTVDQATALLTVATTHRLGALFSVALACGLRLGEATGLRWADLDLQTGELRVRQQLQRAGTGDLVLQELKTTKSRRTLVVPQTCLEALRKHRTRQLEERLKAGDRWVETGLVFTTYRTCKEGKGRGMTVGAGLHPRNVLRILYGLLDDAKLPRVRFHDLRHSAASLLIAEGVQLAEVSLLLGHSELRVTADLYAHLQHQTAAKAARLMDAILKP